METVSVIIPCFNSSSSIENCIRSVLDQTYPVSEILLYNDGSTDDTAAAIYKLESQCKLIKAWSGEETRGAGYARSFLLKKSSSKFIAFLDSDDLWMNNKIEKQMEVMSQDDKTVIVFSGYDIYKKGIKIGHRRPFLKVNFWSMHIANWIPMSTAIVRRSANGSVTMPIMRRRQDYVYWLLILKNNPQGVVKSDPESLVIYNRSTTSLSASKFKNLSYNYRVFRDNLGYSLLSSIFFVFLNSLTRIFRK
jgi:glycosyltransferase involved in cell wall biosynthesis